MTKKKQDIRIAITPKGQAYLSELVRTGYTNLKAPEQWNEWDILQDLTYYGGSTEGISMGELFVERPSTIIGRKFIGFEGLKYEQQHKEGYGRTLHHLIKEGYVKSWIHKEGTEEDS